MNEENWTGAPREQCAVCSNELDGVHDVSNATGEKFCSQECLIDIGLHAHRLGQYMRTCLSELYGSLVSIACFSSKTIEWLDKETGYQGLHIGGGDQQRKMITLEEYYLYTAEHLKLLGASSDLPRWHVEAQKEKQQ